MRLRVHLLLSTVCFLFLSHRLAGPVVRLKGYFAGIANGQPVKPVNFRKGDFFSDLPPQINGALQRLESRRDAA